QPQIPAVLRGDPLATIAAQLWGVRSVGSAGAVNWRTRSSACFWSCQAAAPTVEPLPRNREWQSALHRLTIAYRLEDRHADRSAPSRPLSALSSSRCRLHSQGAQASTGPITCP